MKTLRDWLEQKLINKEFKNDRRKIKTVERVTRWEDKWR